MLFYPSGYPKPVRVQGSFVSDKEVQKVVDYLIDKNGSTAYSNELEEHMMTQMFRHPFQEYLRRIQMTGMSILQKQDN